MSLHQNQRQNSLQALDFEAFYNLILNLWKVWNLDADSLLCMNSFGREMGKLTHEAWNTQFLMWKMPDDEKPTKVGFITARFWPRVIYNESIRIGSTELQCEKTFLDIWDLIPFITQNVFFSSEKQFFHSKVQK